MVTDTWKRKIGMNLNRSWGTGPRTVHLSLLSLLFLDQRPDKRYALNLLCNNFIVMSRPNPKFCLTTWVNWTLTVVLCDIPASIHESSPQCWGQDPKMQKLLTGPQAKSQREWDPEASLQRGREQWSHHHHLWIQGSQEAQVYLHPWNLRAGTETPPPTGIPLATGSPTGSPRATWSHQHQQHMDPAHDLPTGPQQLLHRWDEKWKPQHQNQQLHPCQRPNRHQMEDCPNWSQGCARTGSSLDPETGKPKVWN